MLCKMWFQLSPLLGSSWMLIANMPWAYWTVSTTQKSEGKRTCLLFFHKQLEIDHNNVLGCGITGNMHTNKPSPPPFYCLWWVSAMQANSHSAVLVKGNSPCNMQRPNTHESRRERLLRQRRRIRVGLFSPQIIQQTSFTRSNEHEPAAAFGQETQEKSVWSAGKRKTETQQLHKYRLERERKQLNELKTNPSLF